VNTTAMVSSMHVVQSGRYTLGGSLSVPARLMAECIHKSTIPHGLYNNSKSQGRAGKERAKVQYTE
jgi:hypothetical protein